MNELRKFQIKFLLSAQILPIVFILCLFSFLIISVTWSYQLYGEPTAPFMTDWERNPQFVISQFLRGMEFPLFFFIVGLPFEAAILYIDKQDRKKAAIEAIQNRKKR